MDRDGSQHDRERPSPAFTGTMGKAPRPARLVAEAARELAKALAPQAAAEDHAAGVASQSEAAASPETGQPAANKPVENAP